MEVPLTSETEAGLRRLATDSGQDAGAFVAQLLKAYVDGDESIRQAVEAGLADADAGRWVSETEMDSRVSSWFSS